MDYAVVHSGRRTIAIQIQRDGRVVVRAPYAATAEDIRRVVDSHRDWVEKTVRRQQEQLAASPPEPTAREMEELARQGREYLPRRVAYWAARMDVMPTGLQITAARTRWGSCSSRGNLNFNCLLMLAPEEVLDYVVVHELAHRKQMNHSALFWQEVERECQDYKKSLLWLKDRGGALLSRARAGKD